MDQTEYRNKVIRRMKRQPMTPERFEEVASKIRNHYRQEKIKKSKPCMHTLFDLLPGVQE